MKVNRTVAGYALIAGIGGLLASAVRIEADREYATARMHFVQESHADATAAVRTFELALRSIYENTRTLTFLPSVRKIDRHATNLDAEGHEAIQQLYNNLASGVSVSEVYVVPVDIDPDRIDPVTGKGEEPIVMFDQLVVNAGRFAKEADPFAAAKEEGYEIGKEEIEVFEYRLFKQQMAWLTGAYPDNSSINGLDVPMIGGTEVITCDNTEYSLTGRDADRMGFLFSVPFFDFDGVLKGTVSSIIRTNALRRLLPPQNFALVNTAYQFASPASEGGQEGPSAAFVRAAKADPRLIYSEVLAVNDNDPRSQWAVWVGLPDIAFFNGSEATAVRNFETAGYGVALLLALAASACWGLLRRNLSLVRSNSVMLEQRVAERTAEIAHMATHDALTGLANRTMLEVRMNDALARVRRGEQLAVLALDLDHFKNVNDTLGHGVGDALLREVARRLTSAVRDTDTVTRLGGDEFVILETALGSPTNAGELAGRIIDLIREPVTVDGHQVVPNASIGIAVAPTDGEDVETLLRNADIALYRAKIDGRGTSRFFEREMDASLQRRRQLELALRRAVTAHQFVLFYQPMLDLKSERVTGFEALLRWQHPERGILLPAEFMAVAEEIGVIVPLGEWVLEQACADAARWPADIKVAVNLSPVQFRSPNLAAAVVSALQRSGIGSRRLEIEITESVLLAANETTLATLHQLRNLGVRIAMDDFGTGYSSLSYLRSFPFDKIKIDRSFVQDAGRTQESTAIVRAVAALGASLGLMTTAEGVETREQLASVREQGCVEVQGYYFSQAVPQNEVLKYLARSAKPSAAA